MGKASQLPLIVFCGLLLTASAFSCDITLPAVWSMQQELGASIEWLQAMVPVFLLAPCSASHWWRWRLAGDL